MNRLKLAELTSGVKALVLGVGLGGLFPQVDKIKELKGRGKRVAMVGAVAIGAGTDVAVEAGDVEIKNVTPLAQPRPSCARRGPRPGLRRARGAAMTFSSHFA